jgi:hypothetical protein
MGPSRKAAQPQPHSQLYDFFVSNIHASHVDVADKKSNAVASGSTFLFDTSVLLAQGRFFGAVTRTSRTRRRLAGCE